MHNGIGQILYAAKLRVELFQFTDGQVSVEELNAVKKQASNFIEEAIRETRNVSHELVPVVLHDFGLEEAINDLVNRYNSSNYPIQTKIYGFDQRMDKYREIALYRMAQELLNNTVKHARASKVKL